MSTLDRARSGDEAAFADLVSEHRRELVAHCYRILGSPSDAEDAVQEALVAAWRGLAGFEGRSSLRTWLYRIATHSALRLAERRGPRVMSWDHGPARSPGDDLGEPVTDRLFVEPWLEDPAAKYEALEGVQLAWTAAVQHLPPNQRAVLVLRDVLAFPAAEVADLLETSVPSVNSALQRARATLAARRESGVVPAVAADLTPDETMERELIDEFIASWERADVDALVRLLATDVAFTMPPLPAWFDGVEDVAGFLSKQVFATAWRLLPVVANGQSAFACYQGPDFRLGALNVLSVRDGRIAWIAAFIDPEVTGGLGLPTIFPEDLRHDR